MKLYNSTSSSMNNSTDRSRIVWTLPVSMIAPSNFSPSLILLPHLETYCSAAQVPQERGGPPIYCFHDRGAAQQNETYPVLVPANEPRGKVGGFVRCHELLHLPALIVEMPNGDEPAIAVVQSRGNSISLFVLFE